MGNCLEPVDPLAASIPRGTVSDASPIRQSSLPIVFVLGGPGAGKHTQSTKLAERYSFVYINVNDILREEVTAQSDKGVILGKIMSEGKVVPADVLLELVKLKMLNNLGKTRGFLLNAFPRTKKQAVLFDKDIRSPDLVLYLSVRESLLRDRVMARTITTSQRREYIEDDVRESIRIFFKSNLPIMRHYKKKLAIVDGEQDTSEVFAQICVVFDDLLEQNVSTPEIVSSASLDESRRPNGTLY